MAKKFLLFTFLFLLPVFSQARASSDCYRDCMIANGCWKDMGEGDRYDTCVKTQANCSVQCRLWKHRSYGAIAYSQKDGASGYSSGAVNQFRARETALRYCRQKGKHCKIAGWFYNSCGAVAADKKKTGWGRASSVAKASKQALAGCKKAGGKKCEIKAAHCSKASLNG